MLERTERETDITIAIPTFNRGPILERTLTSIYAAMFHPQATGLRCEILISDNCSTDSTQAEVEKYGSNHPDINLRYHRQKENLGFDRNYIDALRRSRGRYVMTMGDDDILDPVAFFDLQPLLTEKQHYSLIHYNGTRFNQKEKGLTIVDDLLVRMKESRQYNDRDHFFFDPISGYWRFMGTNTTTICTLVLNREEALKVAEKEEVQEHIGSFIIQCHLIGEMLTNHPRVAWVQKPLVHYGISLGSPPSQLAREGGYQFNEKVLNHLLNLGYSSEGVRFMREVQGPDQENLYNVNLASRHRDLVEELTWLATSQAWYRKNILKE